MKEFLKNALEGLYLLMYSPERTQELIMGNIKFLFPLPMFFLFGGVGIHLLLDNPWMNQNVNSIRLLVPIYGVAFNLLAYPVCLRFVIPLLNPDEVDNTNKRGKIGALVLYWFGCFALLIILAWLTNYTRADEFRY
jgi:hypothetical protein